MITVPYRLALDLGHDICNRLKGCCWMQKPERPVRDRLISSCLGSPCQVRIHLVGEDTNNVEQRSASIILSARPLNLRFIRVVEVRSKQLVSINAQLIQ